MSRHETIAEGTCFSRSRFRSLVTLGKGVGDNHAGHGLSLKARKTTTMKASKMPANQRTTLFRAFLQGNKLGIA
jgi:hypothetical protein